MQQQESIGIEQIDLIREAKELPQARQAKSVGETAISPGANGTVKSNNPGNTMESEVSSEEQGTYTKLEEIDLLSSIGRDIGIDLEKYVQPVPDVIAMEGLEVNSARIMSDINKMSFRHNLVVIRLNIFILKKYSKIFTTLYFYQSILPGIRSLFHRC